MSDDRIIFLNEISSFMTESKSYLSNLLSKINWTEDKLLSGPCSDKSFHEQGTSLDFHIDSQINYNLKESNDEINKVYSGIIDIFPQPAKKDKKETLVDILARERDLKRRRIGYKGRIHTKHKSHHEILREVIAQQMEAIEDTISGDLSTCCKQIDDQRNSTKKESVKILDISQMNVCNPHLTWKYVVSDLNQIEDKDKSHKCSKEKTCRSKSELYDDKDSKSVKSYQKNSKHKYHVDKFRSNEKTTNCCENTSYVGYKNVNKEKLKNSSKLKNVHEQLDRNDSDAHQRKSDKDSYKSRKQGISHLGVNRYSDESKDKPYCNDIQEYYDKHKDDAYYNRFYKNYNDHKGLSNTNKEERQESDKEDDLKIINGEGKRNKGRYKKDVDKCNKNIDKCKEDGFMDKSKKHYNELNQVHVRSNKEKESSHYKDRFDDPFTYKTIDRNKVQYNPVSEIDSTEDITLYNSDTKHERMDEHPSKSRKRKKEDRHSKKSKKHRRSRDKSRQRSKKEKKKKSTS